MKAKVLSEFSEEKSVDYRITDEINTTHMRLRAILSEEATVRKTLGALFIKQKEEANEVVRKAEEHLARVKDEQARMQDVIRKETEETNEIDRAIIMGPSAIMGECNIDHRYDRRTWDPVPAEKKPKITFVGLMPQESRLEDEEDEEAERAGFEVARRIAERLEQEQIEREIEASKLQEAERRLVEQEAFVAEERAAHEGEHAEDWEDVARANKEAHLPGQRRQEKEDARRAREEEAEQERKQVAVMIAAMTEFRTAEAEKARQEQEDLERKELEKQPVEREALVAEQTRSERELAERVRRQTFQEASTVIRDVVRKTREERGRQEKQRQISEQEEFQWGIPANSGIRELVEEAEDECVATIMTALELEAEREIDGRAHVKPDQ